MYMQVQSVYDFDCVVYDMQYAMLLHVHQCDGIEFSSRKNIWELVDILEQLREYTSPAETTCTCVPTAVKTATSTAHIIPVALVKPLAIKQGMMKPTI